MRLLDDYGAEELRAAVGAALVRETFGAGWVAHILEQHRRARGERLPVRLELAADPRAAADLAEQLVAALAAAQAPLTRETLRVALHTRNAALGDALVRPRADGRIERCNGGVRLRSPPEQPIPVPAPIVELGRAERHQRHRVGHVLRLVDVPVAVAVLARRGYGVTIFSFGK